MEFNYQGWLYFTECVRSLTVMNDKHISMTTKLQLVKTIVFPEALLAVITGEIEGERR